jgi:hypothetical protein
VSNDFVRKLLKRIQGRYDSLQKRIVIDLVLCIFYKSGDPPPSSLHCLGVPDPPEKLFVAVGCSCGKAVGFQLLQSRLLPL